MTHHMIHSPVLKHGVWTTVVGLALTLTACGGGDSTSTTTPAVVAPVTPPAISVPTPAAATPATTYQIGTAETAAFNVLNSERTACGFGALTQNARLNQATRLHANYIVKNDINTEHWETQPNAPYYTGYAPIDRVLAIQYDDTGNMPSVYSEVVALINAPATTSASGPENIRTLLSAPYHMIGMLENLNDVGMALASSADVNASTPGLQAFDLLLAKKTSATVTPVTQVLTYPCNGTQGTMTGLFNESPNPLPNRDLSTQPVGQPIFIESPTGSKLTINNVTVLDAQGAAVPTQSFTTATDSALASITALNNVGFALPLQPLQPYTRYHVTASVTYGINGASVPAIKDFYFTTGARNTY